MKKIIALGVIAIFLLSIFPTALAQENGLSEIEKKELEKELEKKELEKKELEKELDKAKLEKKELEKKEIEKKLEKKELEKKELKAKLEKKELEKKELEEKLGKRELEKKELTKKELEKKELVKKELKEKKEKYSQEILEISNLKQDIVSCKEQGQDCEAKKLELREKAKNVLSTITEILIKHLEQVKEKVTDSDTLTEAEKNEIIAKIDAQIEELVMAQDQVNEATTKEELTAALKNIKDLKEKTKTNTKEDVTKLQQGRVGLIVERAEHLGQRLDMILADLKEKGISTAEIDPLVKEFKAQIALAKTNNAEALKLFEEAKEASNPERARLMSEANQNIKEAQEALKEAHSILVDILKRIKEISEGRNLHIDYEQGIIKERLTSEATVE